MVIRFTDFLEIDPILGIAFGLVLIYASWGIIKASLTVLMETVPEGIDLDHIRGRLQQIPGVANVHHIHSWSLTTGSNNFSTHMLIEADADSQQVLKDSYEALEETVASHSPRSRWRTGTSNLPVRRTSTSQASTGQVCQPGHVQDTRSTVTAENEARHKQDEQQNHHECP